MSELSKLIELASKLPKGLSSDWDGTNHFEMHSEGDEYFWLNLSYGLQHISNPMDSEVGKRFGLLMDIAAEVGRLRDTGVFDKFLPKLSDLKGLFADSPVDVAGGWEDEPKPTLEEMFPIRFVVCSKCGNKRCPKALDNKYKCTGSNELNQIRELEASDEASESRKETE